MNKDVHPLSHCESKSVGVNTTIKIYATISAGAKIGEACSIGEHAFIDKNVSIDDRVTVGPGARIMNGVILENDVQVEPGVTFVANPIHREDSAQKDHSKTTICKGAVIGANATILSGLTVGQNARIGPGSVVYQSVPPNAIAAGNPAKITGYVDSDGSYSGNRIFKPSDAKISVHKTSVKNVTLHTFPLIRDLRGDLSVGEFMKDIPFLAKRYFLVFDVPSEEIRGEHAHKLCHQFLIAVKGSCAVVADDGINREEFFLTQPNVGLYLPPGIWGIQYKYTSDAVLLVFASEHYDPDDYIRDYQDFISRSKD